MKFIRVNCYKIIFTFIIYIAISSILALILYLNINHSIGTQFLLQLIYGISLVIFIAFFLVAMYNFYRIRRLLSYKLLLNLFDNNEYKKGYVNTKSWLLYSKDCLIGNICNYPAVIFIDIAINRGTQTRMGVTFYVMKNAKTTPWTIYFPLSSLGNPDKGIKVNIINEVSMLNNKGYTNGELSMGLKMDGVVYHLY